MKEFQNWWEKECNWRIGIDDFVSENYAEEAWRAALEWVLDSAGANLDWDKIERELEDEKF